MPAGASTSPTSQTLPQPTNFQATRIPSSPFGNAVCYLTLLPANRQRVIVAVPLEVRFMKTKFLAALALSVTCIAWAADPNPASNTASAPSQEEVVAQFKKDLMADRAQVMAKGLKLDAQQAAKFWPLFETFQKEQAAIVDAQTKSLKDYADHFQTLTDADATAYINSLLDRDQKMHDLRVKWLQKFTAAVGPKSAASAIQLDRRLGNITQVQLSSQIPLIR
jgi:Spy/CpxP family protein refolding chaperone